MPIPQPPTTTTGAALRIFPVLSKWGLITRPGIHAYPIGGSSQARRRAAALSDDEKRACVRVNTATLYHDLGVVAFDGCSYQQAQRVGDILAKTVALRARKRAAVVVVAAGVDVPEEHALEAFEVFPALWKLEEETWGHRLDG